jgi:hypothetical protein
MVAVGNWWLKNVIMRPQHLGTCNSARDQVVEEHDFTPFIYRSALAADDESRLQRTSELILHFFSLDLVPGEYTFLLRHSYVGSCSRVCLEWATAGLAALRGRVRTAAARRNFYQATLIHRFGSSGRWSWARRGACEEVSGSDLWINAIGTCMCKCRMQLHIYNGSCAPLTRGSSQSALHCDDCDS